MLATVPHLVKNKQISTNTTGPAINHIDEAVIIWVSFAATGPGYLAATESNMNTSVYRYLDSI